VSFAAITLCVASQRVFVVFVLVVVVDVVYFVIDSVRKLLDIPSYERMELKYHAFLTSTLDGGYMLHLTTYAKIMALYFLNFKT
jgi:hypothetical protein